MYLAVVSATKRFGQYMANNKVKVIAKVDPLNHLMSQPIFLERIHST